MAGGSGSNSQTGTRTLRWVVAGTAIVLLVVIFGFVIAGKLRMQNYLTNLPGKLGVDIEQETNNWTYSQSSKGRRIFTIRASKEVQHKNGKINLHEAGIVLYGPTGAETDRIHGVDFEYDQKAQLLTATGEVYIDLVPPAKAGAPEADPQSRIIHVKTVGLVFDQQSQVATSDGAVEFRTGGYSGNAVGAIYDSQNGVVVLKSDVHMSGLRQAAGGATRPENLLASRAQLDRKTNIVDLQHAHYTATSDTGSQSFAGEHVIVHIAPDGTPQRVDAAGNVTLATDARGQLTAQQMQMELGPEGQVRDGHFEGDVRFASEEEGRKESGGADDAQIAFDPQGRPVHAVMNGNVALNEQGPASTRHLESATLDLILSGGGKQPSVLRAAQAFGPSGAHLLLVDDSPRGRNSTDVKADRLIGRFAADSHETELTGLDGNGHSTVQRIALNPAGVQQSKDTSQGETLHVDFKPGAGGRSELSRAEQKGSVSTLHEALAASGPKKGQPEIEHSRSDDAVFDAAANTLHLTGSVEVQDEASALFANQVDVNRDSGESVATGAVRVAYTTAAAPGKPPQEPVHVLAARALAHKSSGLAEFFADGAGRVRMWQGTSQVEAPQIDFYQKEKRVVAHGAPGAGAPDVRTVLAGNETAKAPTPGKPQTSDGPVRILSRTMVYTDAARTVEFSGGVRVLNQDGTLTAQQATAWLSAAPGPAQAATGFLGGKLDHIIASGGVVLDQPGRRATGEKLVYTAGDGIFVLTGTPALPPRVVDQAQGTTTGEALKFRSGDESVEILGSLDEKKAGRVRTETRMNH